MMAVRLVESTTQNAPSTILRGLEQPFEHAHILDFVFLLMLLPAVAMFEGTVVTDSAPVLVIWIRWLYQSGCATRSHLWARLA